MMKSQRLQGAAIIALAVVVGGWPAPIWLLAGPLMLFAGVVKLFSRRDNAPPAAGRRWGMASDIKPTAPGIAEIRFLEWATLYSLRLTHEWIKRAVEKQTDAAVSYRAALDKAGVGWKEVPDAAAAGE